MGANRRGAGRGRGEAKQEIFNSVKKQVIRDQQHKEKKPAGQRIGNLKGKSKANSAPPSKEKRQDKLGQFGAQMKNEELSDVSATDSDQVDEEGKQIEAEIKEAEDKLKDQGIDPV